LGIWLAYFIISTVWGTTWFAVRIGLETVPPFLAAGVRCCVAALILYGLLRIRGGSIPLSRVAWRVYTALGILTIGIPFALIYWGQQFVPTGLSSILFSMFPIGVALLSHFMLENERLNAYKIAAVVLGTIGIVVIFSSDAAIHDANGLLGMGAILISVLIQALALVIIKKYGEPVSPTAMNFVGMAMGGVMILVLSAVTESNRSVVWTGPAIASLAYLTVVASVITFLAYYWLLKRIDAVYLSLSSFINPLIAVFIGSAALHERLSPTVFVGAALVLTGMLAANGKALYEKLATRT
jgi:drug/metabolite transporter (DMT)-like permease